MLVCAGGLSALAFISEVKSEEPVVVEGKILVRYESSLSAQEVETIEKEFGLQRLNYMSAINTGYYRISGSEDQIDLIERLRKKTGVVLVEEDLLRTQSAAIPNDPLYGQQWYLNSATATHINFQSAIQAFSGTTTIDVAVIDSGILYNHPDFVGKINTTWAYDYVENDTTAQDENGHGTMVASLIGAAHNNGSGLAGVCPNVRFLPLRVFDNAGRFATTTSGVLVSALQRAYDANVRVVNLSLGGGGYSASELSMFEALNSRGIVAVIAAGNGDSYGRGINNDSSPTYPASYSAPNIISVMATDSSGNATVFSNYGSGSVDIAAPGAGIIAANVRRTTAYNDNFSLGANDWLNGTVPGSSPWTRDYRSFRGSFAPYNMAGIYKYFDFTGKQGLRAELTGYLILGYGDILLFEVWDGTAWNYVDVIAWPGDMALSKSLDVSVFDGQVGYARIMLYCDVWSYGASFTRFCEIDTIKITEVASNSTSNPEYLSVDGTSFSAPLVAGTAALLLSKNPSLTGSQVKQAILSTASTRSSLSGKSVTGGIVNVAAALDAADARPGQTISFGSIASKTYGDSSFTISASSSSGLVVSFSSSSTGVATIAGNTITIIGAGSTTITASQSGDASFSAAANVQQTLTVSPKGVTVVAAAKTKTYGSVDPALTFTASGLLGSDSLSGALSRAAGENAGSYSIMQGTLTAGSNYLISYTGASLSITSATLSENSIITTAPSSLVYDGAGKSYTARANGVSGFSYTYSGVSPTTYASSSTAPVNVGTYKVTASSTDPNYTGNKEENFQIVPATITVVVDAKTKTIGSVDPVLTYSATGLMGSDSLSGALTRAEGEGVGSYSILQGTLSVGANYSIEFTGATFTITPAAQYALSTYSDDQKGTISISSIASSYAAGTILTITATPKSGYRFVYWSGDSTAATLSTSITMTGNKTVTANYIEDLSPTVLNFGSGTNKFDIEFVTIGNINNPINTKYNANGALGIGKSFGSVAYQYSIGKYEISRNQIVRAQASGGNIALSDGYTGDDEADPALGSWNRAARFVNYLNTSKGYPEAYKFNSTSLTSNVVLWSATDPGYNSANPIRNRRAIFFIPTLSEAHKAAYYNPLNGTYVDYPTGSDSPPVSVSSGTQPGTAVYGISARNGGKRTNVKNAGGLSIYGTMAQGGNAWEWTETDIDDIAGYPVANYDAVASYGGQFSSGDGYLSCRYSTTDLRGYSNGNEASVALRVAMVPITQGAVTIEADTKTKAFGSADPELTYTASGLIGSDALSGSLTRTPGENVGSYSILQGTLSGGIYYSISYTGATLQITSAALSQDVITMTAPFSLVYDGAGKNYTASASGVSGFSYTYSGVLPTTYGPSSTAPTNVGTYKITATSIDTNYSGSKEVGFSITPAPVMVVAVAKTKGFGSEDPALTYTASGLIGADSLSGALTRAEGENAGNYSILQGTLSVGSNYSLSYLGADMEITRKKVSVVAEPKSKEYGSGDPVLTYTVSGLLSPDGISGELSRVAGENVGSYTIRIGTLTVGDNYFIDYTASYFAINPAAVTVVAAAKTKAFGSADPALTFTASGLIGSDSLTGALGRRVGENAGNYEILIGTLSAGSNYTLSYTGASLEVTAATLISSSINISGPFTYYYDGTAKNHTASASGVGGFSYTYSGVTPTTYGPTTIAPTNVGTYKVTASSTDLNYSGSKEVSFSITPTPVTVVAVARTKVFGTADPTLTYTASGLISPDILSGALARAEGENAGSYSILQGTLSLGSNYSLSYTGASLQINPAPVTVVAAAKTKAFGSADPALTYTASGLIGADSLSGALTRVEGENAGSYSILRGTLSVGSNYSISYTGASLQITSATLSENSITITAPSSLVYDGAGKSYTASASGVSGFSYIYSGVSPTMYASSSAAPSNVGTYKVTAGSTDLNYSGSKEVSFSITTAPVAVVPTAKTKTFGSADPALTYTASGLIGSDSLSGSLTRGEGEDAGIYSILQGTLSGGSNYSISYTEALFTINPAELASSAINITEPSNLVYNGLAKDFSGEINISGSVQTEIIQLSEIGNPSSGYGVVHNLSAGGYRTTSYSGIDGVFRPYQSETKITSTGLTYSFAANLVGTSTSGETARPPWQNTTAATGGPTGQLDSYFSPLGINWSQNSLFAAPSSGITYDLSKLKPANKNLSKFTTYYGMHSGAAPGDAAFAVLLDGVLVASGRDYKASNPFSGLIEINISPNNRFLTLVACDNGDDYDWDHSVFVDPKLAAVDSTVNASLTYSGIAGTLYGPTSIPPSNAGNYKVTASSSDPNYSGSKEVNFVITPAPIVVVAQNKTKKYGLTDPELTFSATGLLGSDTLSGALTRATGESPGTYAISLGTLSGTPNYLLSYTGSSFVIQPNYQSWAAAQNLFDNDALKDSDPDQDGMSNAHEFAMGGNPSVASTATIVITSAPGGIKFLWIERKDKTLVSYLPKTSADLGAPFSDWTPVQSVLSSPQPEGIHSDYEQVEVVLPTSAGKGFLKIEANVQ